MKFANHDIIEIIRRESNFDKACDEARREMLCRYGIDDDSASTFIDFVSSTDTLCIEFSCYQRRGSEHWYTFEIWTERDEGDSQ